MRFISTKTHGYIDYLAAITLLIVPWLLSPDRQGAETWLPISLGAATVIYSLFTNYEMGIGKRLSMKVHLVLDFLSGAVLAASPWLFGFNEYISMPFVVAGLFEIVVSLTTKTQSTEEKLEGSQARHRASPTN